jgi:hypothetical protein
MTHKVELEYCKPDDLLEDKLGIMQQKNFDNIPMLQGNDLETGEFHEYLTQENIAKKINEGCRYCKEASIEIPEENKIHEDAAIKQFIATNPFSRDNSKGPIFAVNNSKHVTGLVTLADLDKVAARMYFFALFSELEISLIELFSSNYASLREVCTCDYCIGKRNFRKKHIQLDENLEEYHYLFLKEIIHIVMKSKNLCALHEKVKAILQDKDKELTEFRNNIVHPKPLVSNKFPVAKLRATQFLIDRIVSTCKNAPSSDQEVVLLPLRTCEG